MSSEANSHIEIRLFAGARSAIGQSQLQLEVPPGSTVGELRQRLARDYPHLRDVITHSLFALEDAYVSDATVLPNHAAVAWIPPVSGG